MKFSCGHFNAHLLQKTSAAARPPSAALSAADGIAFMKKQASIIICLTLHYSLKNKAYRYMGTTA